VRAYVTLGNIAVFGDDPIVGLPAGSSNQRVPTERHRDPASDAGRTIITSAGALFGETTSLVGERVQRRLLAILSADVVGYSRLMGIDEAGTLARLQELRREIIDPTISTHSGRTIKLIGDGALVAFDSVVDAVACALETQKLVGDRNADRSEDQQIQFRIGINVGDVIVDGDDIYGDGVNVAARIEALAEPGSIFIARAAADEVRDKLPVKFEPKGERRVKNVARPIEVFRVCSKEAGASLATAPEGAWLMHWPPESDRDRAPYRGLKPLETIDAGIFFGRDAPIAEGMERIRALSATGGTRLLVILGASGAGKSSYLRAGLLPQLEHDSGHFLPLPAIRPERSALLGENGLLGALEAVLPKRTRAEIRATIRERAGVPRLLLEYRNAKARRREGDAEGVNAPAVVLAIDQAEELFRVEGANESAALLEVIRDLATQDEPTVIVIFAIRSDSYDSLQHAKALEDLPQSALPLLPMPRTAFKEVIEGPARRFVNAGGKLTIEPQLTLRLLEDIDRSGSGDALPLLAFTLEQLFLEYRRAGALRLENYEEFGGLRGAISAAVERSFSRADADPRIPHDRKEREALLRRGLIPWLAGIDPDTKSPRRNIAQRRDIPEEARLLIDLLVEERLLTTDSQTTRDQVTGAETQTITIEPAHEALLRQWSLLERWLLEDFGLLATLEGIKRAARDWEANGSTEEWLTHQGLRLSEASALDDRPDLAAQLEPRDRAYLHACETREVDAAAEREKARVNELARARAEADKARAGARFARNLTLVSIVGTFLVACVSLWAWQQRNAAIDQRKAADSAAEQARVATRDATAQRNRAEAAITDAIDAANTLVFSMVQKLRNVTGMKISLVQAILDPALKLQDNLIKSGENSVALRRSQSTALVEAAKTQLAVGDTDGALANAIRSRNIVLELLKQQSDIGNLNAALSSALAVLGAAQEAAGRLSDGIKTYEENRTIVDQVASADPSNLSLQDNLSKAYTLLGTALLRGGRVAEAAEAYDRALGITRDRSESNPNLTTLQSDLSTIYLGLSDVRREQGRLRETIALLSESMQLIEGLELVDPTNTNWKRSSSVRLGKLIEARLQQGDVAHALKDSNANLAIMENLVQSDPTNTDWQHDLSVAYLRAGDVQKWRMSLTEAHNYYSRATAIRERIVRSDPGNTLMRRNLAYAQTMVGDIESIEGQASKALLSYSDAMATLQQLARSDPVNADWQRDLSRGFAKLGEAQLAVGNGIEAVGSLTSSSSVLQGLIGANPTNVLLRELLAYVFYWKGNAELAVGHYQDALDFFLKSREIRERIATDAIEDRQNQFFLGKDFAAIGDVQLKLLQAGNAISAYAGGLEIFTRISKLDPENAIWAYELAMTNAKLAAAYEVANDTQNAEASAKAARALLQGLVLSHPELNNWKSEIVDLDARITAYAH
jgi:class 3 adenylate cyclase/tetratricopeptide (TPR) repeat protein